MFLYIIFLSWNVENYKEGNHSEVDKECISKVQFNSEEGKTEFLRGLEFAGWTEGVEFQLINEMEYYNLT